MSFKHALTLIITSTITFAMPVWNSAWAQGQSPNNMPGWGSPSQGGRSPGAGQGGTPSTGAPGGGHSFFVPGPFMGLLPAGTRPNYPDSGQYINSPWVPTNPYFGPTPTQPPVTKSPSNYGPAGR